MACVSVSLRAVPGQWRIKDVGKVRPIRQNLQRGPGVVLTVGLWVEVPEKRRSGDGSGDGSPEAEV